MQIATSKIGFINVIAPSPPLIEAHVNSLNQAIQDNLKNGEAKILLDFSGVSHIDSLGLEFSERIERLVEAQTNLANPTEAPRGGVHHFKRDSRATATVWKSRLTECEIDRIRTQVEDVSRFFYADEDW